MSKIHALRAALQGTRIGGAGGKRVLTRLGELEKRVTRIEKWITGHMADHTQDDAKPEEK